MTKEEVKLFDPKFVHFIWDDELKGKNCFVADNIGVLKAYVESCESRSGRVVESDDNGYPFLYDDADECCGSMYQFAYYDPNYEAKWAYYKEGKKVQCKSLGEWVDCDTYPLWEDACEYRVKPECPCEDGIDSKACVGCEHSDDGKQYRPYRDALEFIADYGKRFPTATPRPLGTMPLIWIAHKTDGTTRLIVEFSDRSVKIGCKVKPVDFGKLFEYWTYTDGSPVGKEAK